MNGIREITMPKWGLAMTEGRISSWLKQPGAELVEGEPLVEIETSKITNVFEAPFGGRLARIVVAPDEIAPVGALIAVVAASDVSEAAIDACITSFEVAAPKDVSAGGDDGTGLRIETIAIDGAGYRLGRLGDWTSDAVPVVLVHGFSGSIESWMFNMDALAAVAPVLILELPGHGQSVKSVGDGSLGYLVAIVRALLQAAGVERADFVGHSLGGAVAMRLAFDIPELVRSLALLAPVGLPGARLNADFIQGVVNAQSARKLLPALKDLFQNAQLATRDMAEEMMKFKRLDGADEALQAIGERLVEGSEVAALAGRLSELPAVTTLILGMADAVIGQPDAALLPSDWQQLSLSAGHMPQMEQAADVNRCLVGHLRKAAEQ